MSYSRSGFDLKENGKKTWLKLWEGKFSLLTFFDVCPYTVNEVRILQYN